MEILPNIYWFRRLNVSYCYAVKKQNSMFSLIDTGVAVEAASLLLYFKLHKIKLSEVLLTHSHPDHAGNASWVKQLYKVPVYAHQDEIPFLTKKARMAKRKYEGEPIFTRMIIEPGDRLLPQPVVMSVKENSEFYSNSEEFEFHHFPGHTNGNGVVYHKPSKSIFLGDTLVNCEAVHFMPKQGLQLPYACFCEDYPKAISNLPKLLDIDFKNAFFGHGHPILGDAKPRIEKFLRSNELM